MTPEFSKKNTEDMAETSDEIVQNELESSKECDQSNDEMLDGYKNTLDFLKKVFTYAILVVATVMLFGALEVVGFLWFSDLLWIASYIEYSAIFVAGIPFAIPFFLAFALHFFFHISWDYTKISYASYALLFLVFVLLYILRLTPLMDYMLFFLFSYGALMYLPAYFDWEKTASVYNTKKWVFNSSMSFMVIMVLGLPFLSGVMDSIWAFNTALNTTFTTATIKTHKWRVLLNNNDSFILSDLNDSSRIKIATFSDIDYFTRNQVPLSQRVVTVTTNDSNRTHSDKKVP